MGTGFCVSALGAGISAENVIVPTGIAPALQFLAAGIALGVIAVHIAVFVGIDGLRTGVGAFFLIPAGSTFVGAVERVVEPAGVPPSLSHRAALRTLGLVAVHILVLTGVHLGIAVGAGGKNRHRQDGHNHQYREKRTQNF